MRRAALFWWHQISKLGIIRSRLYPRLNFWQVESSVCQSFSHFRLGEVVQLKYQDEFRQEGAWSAKSHKVCSNSNIPIRRVVVAPINAT